MLWLCDQLPVHSVNLLAATQLASAAHCSLAAKQVRCLSALHHALETAGRLWSSLMIKYVAPVCHLHGMLACEICWYEKHELGTHAIEAAILPPGQSNCALHMQHNDSSCSANFHKAIGGIRQLAVISAMASTCFLQGQQTSHFVLARGAFWLA